MKRNHSLLVYTRDNDTKVSELGTCEPSAQGELLWSFTVHLVICLSVRPSTIFKQHLLLNQWANFNQISQDWS